MTLMDLANLLIYVGAVVGAVGSLGLAARWLGRRWRKWLREEIATLRAPIEETRLNSEQLATNGGTSMFDKVNRLTDDVHGLTDRFDRHLEHHAGIVRQEFRVERTRE